MVGFALGFGRGRLDSRWVLVGVGWIHVGFGSGRLDFGRTPTLFRRREITSKKLSFST